jgi:hypothetical protein
MKQSKQMRKARTTAGIFALLAREAREAVVIRRGPSKLVQLLRWNTQTDEFEAGQWFKGRIYERRCDLSPSGKYFLYFAAKEKGPHPKWTAISRPPYLTALAFWSAGWETGGGLFESETRILLNQSPSGLDPRFKLGELMKVEALTVIEGKIGRGVPFHVGTDLKTGALNLVAKSLSDFFAGTISEEVAYEQRLFREGWQLSQIGVKGEYDSDCDIHWAIQPPTIYSKVFQYSKQCRL